MRSPRPVALLLATLLLPSALAADPAPPPQPPAQTLAKMDDDAFKDWFAKWEKFTQFSEEQMTGETIPNSWGEDLGWRVGPYLDAYYHAFLLTHDKKWLAKQIEMTDALIARAVKEPDGYFGWPSKSAFDTSIDDLDKFDADSMVSDALILRPTVLLAKQILTTPALAAQYADKAESYIKFCDKMGEKWEKRGAWRDVKNGNIPVILPYGLDDSRTDWLDGFDKKNDPAKGLSYPNFKANIVARWMLAMADVTAKPAYRQHAEKWFTLFKSRLTLQDDGTYKLWDTWQPAGDWDYNSDGTPKDTVAPAKKPGFYESDLAAVVDAYEHNLVFTKTDLEHLAATGLALQKEKPPGIRDGSGFFSALVPYNTDLQKTFEQSFPPAEWPGLTIVPHYLLRQTKAYPALTPLLPSQIPATDKETATAPAESNHQDPH